MSGGSENPKPAPSPIAEPNWVLETWARGLLEVVRRLCLSYLMIDRWEESELDKREKAGEGRTAKRNWELGRALYLLGWLVGLFAAWVINPGTGWVMILVGGLACWRLFEILVAGLGTALGQTAQIRARNLVTIGVYGLQMTLIFAIAYHSFATTGFGGSPLSKSDYLYISWAALTSLGNDTFNAKSEGARYLEVATTTAGIFLFGVLLAFGINEVQKSREGDGDGESGGSKDGQPKAPAAQVSDIAATTPTPPPRDRKNLS